MILFFGPAGSGKSTQCRAIADMYNWEWISSGNLLRMSEEKEIKDLMSRGELVSSEKINNLIFEAISSVDRDVNIILDGYPRSKNQLDWIYNKLKDLGRVIQIAVVIDLPVDEAKKRLESRARQDDTKDSIEERLRIYKEEITPVIDRLNHYDVDIFNIDGVGSIEDIQEVINQKLIDSGIA